VCVVRAYVTILPIPSPSFTFHVSLLLYPNSYQNYIYLAPRMPYSFLHFIPIRGNMLFQPSIYVVQYVENHMELDKEQLNQWQRHLYDSLLGVLVQALSNLISSDRLVKVIGALFSEFCCNQWYCISHILAQIFFHFIFSNLNL